MLVRRGCVRVARSKALVAYKTNMTWPLTSFREKLLILKADKTRTFVFYFSNPD